MRRFFYFNLAALAFFLLLDGSGAWGAEPSQAQANAGSQDRTHENEIPVCPGPAEEGSGRCHAHVVTDANGMPRALTAPSGYGPSQLLDGYSLSGIGGNHRVIAIVDAYDDPNIKSDLDTYIAQFGMPPFPTCIVAAASSSFACFQKVNQRGGSFYPKTNAGWALEIALDVEVAHAICEDCSILLVEADSNSFANLLAAEDTAGRLGASVISNSWGGSEFSSELSYDSHFNKPNIAITVSSGDSGYGVEYPASSRYVTAVGGTTLTLDSNNSYVSESAWSGAGSGCSAYEAKPAWQTDANCPLRTVADVSADADPNTGAAVYDSVKYFGQKGWFQVGGTSLSSPLVAAVYALSGNTLGSANQIPYTLGNVNDLHDVTTGSNGNCGGLYLCTAMPGYDGPTGLGSPKGIGAF